MIELFMVAVPYMIKRRNFKIGIYIRRNGIDIGIARAIVWLIKPVLCVVNLTVNLTKGKFKIKQSVICRSLSLSLSVSVSKSVRTSSLNTSLVEK